VVGGACGLAPPLAIGPPIQLPLVLFGKIKKEIEEKKGKAQK
jgi:hypothetical protein